MTAKLLVLYRHPADPAAFDAYYRDVHVPLAKRLPGLADYEVSSGPVGALGRTSPYHLVATLSFASRDALKEALRSPEGAATAADVGNFASAGVEMMTFETADA